MAAYYHLGDVIGKGLHFAQSSLMLAMRENS